MGVFAMYGDEDGGFEELMEGFEFTFACVT
jgi:hypothetical protein